MAANYDVSLDDIIKKNRKQRRNKVSNIVRKNYSKDVRGPKSKVSNDRREKPRKGGNRSYQNRDAPVQNFTRKNYVVNRDNKKLIKSHQKFKNRTSNIKQNKNNIRLSINTSKQPSTKNKFSKKNSIIKTSVVINGKNKQEVRLFTSHFDARDKLKSKETTSKKENTKLPQGKGARQQSKSTSSAKVKNITKQTLNQIRKDNRFEKQNERRNLQMVGNKLKVTAKAKESNVERNSIFTGKSIQVVTKNELRVKERNSLLKGKQLKVTANNKQIPQNRKTQASSRGPVMRVHHNDDGPSHSPSPAKKSLASMGAKVIISNLHPNVSQGDIKELFGAIGDLVEASLVSVGTAEVVFRNIDDALASYSKYNGRNLDGQPMMCKITAIDNEPPPPPPKPTARAIPVYSSSAPAAPTKPVVFTVKL